MCVIQGFFLLKDTDFTFSWRKAKDTNFDTFSQSLLDEYKQDKKDHWDRFDQFFDDDFFRGRNDPFQEMEDMQNRMREMMENSFQGSFNDSWDGWFSSRFHNKSDNITVQTKEKEDSVEEKEDRIDKIVLLPGSTQNQDISVRGIVLVSRILRLTYGFFRPSE